jgi:menaquinone-dependent protoporphyrinogen oxidase
MARVGWTDRPVDPRTDAIRLWGGAPPDALLSRRRHAMHRALIVYASRHGATQGIAERIGEVLRGKGVDADVAAATHQPSPTAYDAVIVGSGVYMGSWLKEGIEYLEQSAAALKARPTWLFSSGPIPNDKVPADAGTDPYQGALGPAEGPGSGGRKKIEALAALIGVRGHRVFQGAFDPEAPPKVLVERFARMIPAVKSILPAGDFREWDKIEGWAEELAAQIALPVPVG